MLLRSLILSVCLALLPGGSRLIFADTPAGAPPATTETKDQRDARMAWWRAARFGMFIHWGLYAEPGGVWHGKTYPGLGEWLMFEAQIPVNDYAKLAKKFDPVKFNADQWVSIAKQAGMKYIVITAKHHEGFAMFHTAVDHFNIYDATPFKRDPLAELAVACRKQGIKLGFYYSQAQDWHHAGGGHAGGPGWDPAQKGNMDDYIRKVVQPQVKELLTNYGPVSVFWWDTPVDMTPARAGMIAPLLKLQPQIITNSRLGGGYLGDTGNSEGEVPPFPETDHDWETCMTINGTWGYRRDALDSVRPASSLLLDLVNTASKGGNYLLNVGPGPDGRIPAVEVDRLRDIGKWLAVNGASIYGTQASPFRQNLSWGRVTQKPGRLYLHVLKRPADGKILVPVTNRVVKAYWLANPQHALKASFTPQGPEISLPARLPDPVDSVVVAEIDGAAVPQPVDEVAHPRADGSMRMDPSTMHIAYGPNPKRAYLRGKEDRPYFNWNDKADVLSWQAGPTRDANYDVLVNYSSWPDEVGALFSVSLGDQQLIGTIQPTKSGYIGQEFKIGTVHLPAGSVIPVTWKTEDKRHGDLCSVFGVVLKPAAKP